MPSRSDGTGSEAYRPTSINFINLPNPIEPPQPPNSTQRHPLNGTPRFDKARLEEVSNNRDLFKILLDSSSERPSKRQKPTENTVLDLPKLPVRDTGKQRLRIPPTLSGLHQPPPDAGLLPSISVEQPQVLPPRQAQHVHESVPKAPQRRDPQPDAVSAKPDPAPTATSSKARQRRKWSDQETDDLLKGVAQFGIGNWTKILNCEDNHFDKRTALDLKDRFRVCCPKSYKNPKSRNSSSTEQPSEGVEQEPPAKPKTSSKGPPREEVSSSKLQQLGISEPFVNVGRRNRHEYTAAEDEALLKGFRKHGNSWSAIRRDNELDLSGRRAADLRDRFRTRYPAEYAKAGSKSGTAKRVVENGAEKVSTSEGEVALEASKQVLSRKEDSSIPKLGSTRKAHHLPLFSLDDVFLGAEFGEDDENGERIVLDRGILDWAGADAGKSASNEAAKNTGIDPLMTVKLSRPMSNNVLTALPSGTSGTQNNANSSSNTNSLPSLASVLPDATYPDQIELPSLMQMIGSMENDGRTGTGNFPSLEDLLS